jgi:orotate phosphoribosyltransferase
MYDLIKSRKSWKIKAIGGLTLGADPISNAIAYTSYRKDDPLESFVVRKEPKKHGTMLWVEGNVAKGDKVIIVEDVVTTGGSTIKAIDRARKCGLNVLGVIVLIDRQEGGKQAVEKKGVPVKVLFTREEIMASHRTSV